MDTNIQDWTPVVIKKPKKEKENKPHISKPPSCVKTTYTENGEEVSKFKIVSHEMAQFIIKARTEKNLKQCDVAKRANLDIKIISEIEKGGCIYNAINVNKIAKVLGVNIPRK
jgi:ribosome-binding protein aMBF1 (putative translation factor)